MCSAGFYAAKCGGVQPGECSECAKCKGDNSSLACQGSLPDTCKQESSNSASSIANAILISLGAIAASSFVGSCICMQCAIKQERDQRAKAIALREEKLQAQGLVCVRLVNRTAGVVQVRLPACSVP